MNPALQWPAPGVVWGDYPQRAPDDPLAASSFVDTLPGMGVLRARGLVARHAAFAARVMEKLRSGGGAEGDAGMAAGAQSMRHVLARGATSEALQQAFTLAARAMRATLGMTPYATQIMAARIMLDGALAEMATGEGKTLAIGLAAAVAALGGTPVHLVTANDYLAVRDAQALEPFYAALDLRAGAVTQPMDQAARRVAYGCHVTYCTAKELAFDYLRDGLSRPRALSDLEHRARRLGGEGRRAPLAAPLLRGLCMALIDEADTVLLDEARVPLALSLPAGDAGTARGEAEFHAAALACAARLQPGGHYALSSQAGVQFTGDGRAAVQAWPWPLPGPGSGQGGAAVLAHPRHREDAVALALAALHLYQRDRDYVVRSGTVLIVDENTGRAAPGRAWSRGLHQLIELKEGVAATARNSTVSQITYQRFFTRYLRLGGMSGTLAGSGAELAAVYGTAVVPVPLRQPSRREKQPLRLWADSESLWPVVARRVAALHARGQPVLVGTGSVAESTRLSAVLAGQKLDHAVLNARQDAAEGDIVAAAGQRGRITVATSMAGRGTDIELGEGVARLGGLHVILCQHNGSRRIDRQFLGRCARRGEPGSTETMLALDMPLFQRWLPPAWRVLAARPGLPLWLRRLSAAWPQWLEEREQRGQRDRLRRQDEALERDLPGRAF